MMERGRGADLPQEALSAQVLGELGAEKLDRYLPLVAEVARQEDSGHPARAEFPLDRVGSGRAPPPRAATAASAPGTPATT